MKHKFIFADMNVSIDEVVNFITEDERNYNRVEECLQILAIHRHIGCLEYMARPSKNVMEAAIMYNPFSIGRMKKPPREIQLLAIQLNHEAIDFIAKPCPEAVSLAKLLA